jgi:hypothetical protein
MSNEDLAEVRLWLGQHPCPAKDETLPDDAEMRRRQLADHHLKGGE